LSGPASPGIKAITFKEEDAYSIVMDCTAATSFASVSGLQYYGIRRVETAMKKVLSLTMVLFLALTLILSACSKDSNTASNSTAPTVAAPTVAPAESITPSDSAAPATDKAADDNTFTPTITKDTAATLTLWAAWPLDSWVTMFKTVFPNVKVNLVVMDEIEGKLKTALAAGSGAPDLAFLDGGLMGNYNTIKGFENLLDPAYGAGEYESKFSPAVWQRFMSLDGKRLISIPTDTAPAVTFYRSDIMEEAGFPSDPAELNTYFTDPDNFINIAKTLKAQGKYLVQWDTEPLNIYTFGIGFFDRQLKWQRNTDQFVKGLDLAKRFKQEKLASNIDFWSDEGTQALAAGKTAMTFLGNWGVDEITNKAPDTRGKWHVTNLPFGAFGGWGGASIGITSQSKNKELAWNFTKMILLTNEYANKENIASGGTPAFLPAYEMLDALEKPNAFLGDQKTGKLYMDLIQKIPESVSTPLDTKAQQIWDKGIKDAMDKNVDSKTALQNIQDEIEKVLGNDITKLKADIGVK
jgi:multiple sugar transport system substrate-binding protein